MSVILAILVFLIIGLAFWGYCVRGDAQRSRERIKADLAKKSTIKRKKLDNE